MRRMTNYEPQILACEYHKDSARNVMTNEYHTKNLESNENYRLVAESGTNAFINNKRSTYKT